MVKLNKIIVSPTVGFITVMFYNRYEFHACVIVTVMSGNESLLRVSLLIRYITLITHNGDES